MILLLAALLAGILGVLVWLGVEIRGLRLEVLSHTEATEKLRLDSRARVRTLSVQSGPVTDDQRLRRLGRSTRAKRVVVGGEVDSPLHTNLSKQVSGDQSLLGGEQDERPAV